MPFVGLWSVVVAFPCRSFALIHYVSINIYFTDRSKVALLLWIICLLAACVSHAFASVYCCLVVTCWKRADSCLLLVMLMYFCTFPCGILGLVLDWIVS